MLAASSGYPSSSLVFGLITMIAVGNSALINLLMASRLVYGMSEEGVLPSVLGKVNEARKTPTTAILFTTALAAGLITFVGEVPQIGGTTALLLGVFTVVNVAVLVLRRDKVVHDHFCSPRLVSEAGAVILRLPRGPLDKTRSNGVHDCSSADRHRRAIVGRNAALGTRLISISRIGHLGGHQGCNVGDK